MGSKSMEQADATVRASQTELTKLGRASTTLMEELENTSVRVSKAKMALEEDRQAAQAKAKYQGFKIKPTHPLEISFAKR